MNDLYLKQMLAGRDFARKDGTAAQMLNFSYAIGSRERRECVLIDPAWDVQGLIDQVSADGMKVIGALATHWHPDHVGGDLFGHDVEGIAQFINLTQSRVWVNPAEREWILRTTGVAPGDLMLADSGTNLVIGSVEITFLHTPGHTPGSQCFLVGDDLVVSGDTLFLQGCGRTDLPGGNAEDLYFSLTRTLSKLPGTTVLYPGHRYDPKSSATMAEVRQTNQFLRVPNLEAWLELMG